MTTCTCIRSINCVALWLEGGQIISAEAVAKVKHRAGAECYLAHMSLILCIQLRMPESVKVHSDSMLHADNNRLEGNVVSAEILLTRTHRATISPASSGGRGRGLKQGSEGRFTGTSGRGSGNRSTCCSGVRNVD